jgi:hypothetical protein
MMKHANPLRPIDLSWPFTNWGINIVAILPRAPGGFRYLFIGIDTFTKWIEVMLVIYRFGTPKRVLMNNGTQFKGAKFVRCCTDFGIHHQPSSAAHPQMNGQVERANGLLSQGMKARMFEDLEAKGRNWHKELPLVLWALRTNINIATRGTPFNLVYGADAVLPPEIFLESARVAHFDEKNQEEAWQLDSNLLEKRCNTALANVRKYQESLKK